MWKRHRLLSSVQILIDPDLEFLHMFLHADGWNKLSVISVWLLDFKLSLPDCFRKVVWWCLILQYSDMLGVKERTVARHQFN